MIEFGLLAQTGRVLDIGCGNGADSLFLAQKGYEVTSVDIKEQNINNPKITFIRNSIESFEIEKNTYAAIIARNVLPFVKDKKVVESILQSMTAGLTEDGCMFFTIFGVKDDWFGKEHMSFFTETEIDSLVSKLPVTVFEKNAMEGFGLTMAKDIKYWNVFSYLCTKKVVRNK